MENNINIKDRNLIDLTGVKNIISFDSEEFLLDTEHGQLHIKGENLTISKMDTDNEILQIRGKINQFSYLDDKKENSETKKEGFFTKLFK